MPLAAFGPPLVACAPLRCRAGHPDSPFNLQSSKEKLAMTYTDTRLLIDNEWVDATGGKTL